jgi:heme exporter protein A
VTKAFGRRVALRDVSLTLEPGTACAVLGPNGAGKTTLLRLAAGLARPTSGRLLVDGSPSHAAARLRQRVGYLAHQTLLYDGLTARQNLVFFGRLYGVPDPAARASDLLSEIGLELHADRNVGSLSRGMQQRVALARALVHQPAFLIFDEPATGLDAAGRELLRGRLAALRSTGGTLLLALHVNDLDLAATDSVTILREGELLHQGAATGLGRDALEGLYRRALGDGS